MIYITCLCGKVLKKDLKGEGVILCKRCYRSYTRWFNPKTDSYEFILDDSKLKRSFLK